jgi:hypothetical protein
MKDKKIEGKNLWLSLFLNVAYLLLYSYRLPYFTHHRNYFKRGRKKKRKHEEREKESKKEEKRKKKKEE